MKPASILREVWRDITTGTAHTRGLALTGATIIVLAATAEMMAIHQLTEQAQEFNRSGASTSILTLDGKIDGERCNDLTQMPGVRASGAVRATNDAIKPAVIPGAPLPVYEVSPGFISVIGADSRRAGVLLGPEASEALGIHGPGAIATAHGTVPVAGSYAYPDDGRRPGFSYAAIAPDNSDAPFDECWVDTWPVKDITTALLSTVRTSGPHAEQPVLSQLNTTLGKTFEGETLYSQRVTRFSGAFAAMAGFVLGLISVRIRKLSLASALHAGVPRRALFGIITLETIAWCVASAALGLSIVVLLAAAIADGAASTVFRGVIAASPLLPGAFAGAWVGVMTIKEEHLFSYFKAR